MHLAFDNPLMKTSAVTLKLAPLDVPLRIEVAPPLAADAVVVACRGWGGDEHSRSKALHLRIGVSPALSGTGQAEMQVGGSSVTVRGPGVSGGAQLERGLATCAISAEYLTDPAALRQEVLEPLVLMLLTRRDRTPLHASGFIVDGLAVLLAGRSGAGKSCLARAADAAGFQVLSDDAVFVQLAPRLTVWGWPTSAYLLAEDVIGAEGPTRWRNGKVKRVVPLRSASEVAIRCRRAVMCLLSRGTEPALSPISGEAAMERLWPLDEGFDLLPAPIAKALARLTAKGAWDLQLSADPADAIRLLMATLPRLRHTASP